MKNIIPFLFGDFKSNRIAFVLSRCERAIGLYFCRALWYNASNYKQSPYSRGIAAGAAAAWAGRPGGGGPEGKPVENPAQSYLYCKRSPVFSGRRKPGDLLYGA